LPFLGHLEVAEGILDGFKRVVISQIPMRTLRPAIIALGLLVLFYFTAIGQFTYEIEGETTRALTAETAMVINFVSILVALLLSIWLIRHVMPGEVRTAKPVMERKEWFSTSRDMMFTSGFNLILVQADVMMLGALIDEDAAGVYTVASRMALLLILALNAVNAILQPLASDLYSNDRFDELQRIVSLGANGVFIVSLVGSVVLYFGAPYMHLLFGPEFREASGLLRILIIGQLVNAFAGPAVLLLNMTGYHRDSARIMAAGAAINIVLNAVFINLFSTPGAAIATATTTVVWNLVAAYIVWSRLKIVSIAFWRFRIKPVS
jgi:O-antigen/teichoic acid export membrane protein